MEQPIDSVVVKFGLYGKKLKPPYHEFVLFELGNTRDSSLRNHVVLDRSRLDGASVLPSIQPSRSAAARDEFRFSCDGDQEKLLERCKLTPYEAIETVDFSADDLLPLYELAIVALATSLQRDRYHLLDANCYWFASLIWEQVLEMYPEAKHEVLREGVRGTFGSLYSYTSDELEREEIEIKMQAMLSHMEAIITEVASTSGGNAFRMSTQGRYDSADPGSPPMLDALNSGSIVSVAYSQSEGPDLKPKPHTPASQIAMSRRLPRINASDYLQSPGLPYIARRSLKRFRKYYITNLSSKNGSTQGQVITSGAYFEPNGLRPKSIRLETLGSDSGARGVLILEAPQPQKEELSRFRRLSIGDMVAINSELGHFRSIPLETPDGQAHRVPSATPSQTTSYQTPLPLDNSLEAPQSTYGVISSFPRSSDTPANIQAPIDGVMKTFGSSLLYFHYRVLMIERKRDHASQKQQYERPHRADEAPIICKDGAALEAFQSSTIFADDPACRMYYDCSNSSKSTVSPKFSRALNGSTLNSTSPRLQNWPINSPGFPGDVIYRLQRSPEKSILM
ncbi:hypothetical protein RSOL_012780, partial [Rhizoctonia solani AG-3 Rhs1AP]